MGIDRQKFVAGLIRPWLWTTALFLADRTLPRRWWRKGLPRPDTEYLRFRELTAYGNADAPIGSSDFIRYLEWVKQMRRL